MVATAFPIRLSQSSAPARERRAFARTEVHGRADAWRMDHTVAARRSPRLSLQLRDVSLGGISALADEPLGQGEHLSVYLPPRDGLPAWDAFGRVVRCEPGACGYRVAVEFDPLPAA